MIGKRRHWNYGVVKFCWVHGLPTVFNKHCVTNTRGRPRSAPVPPWSSLDTPAQTWLRPFDWRWGASPCRTASFSPASCAGSSKGPGKNHHSSREQGREKRRARKRKTRKQMTMASRCTDRRGVLRSVFTTRYFTVINAEQRDEKANTSSDRNRHRRPKQPSPGS